MRGPIIAAALATITASCTEECPEGLVFCSVRICVDLDLDQENCGKCDNACEPGHVCEAGVCTLSCLDGYTDCSGVCRDLMSDEANCGWCGLRCFLFDECIDGLCTPI